MSRLAQIWRTRPRFIERLWRRMEAREASVVDDLFGFCTSRAPGSSGNTISLKWSLDLYKYEVGCDPLKLLATRGSTWSGIWTWIFQVRWIEGRRRFLWVEFCELLPEVLKIWNERPRAFLDLLPPWFTLAMAILTTFDNPSREWFQGNHWVSLLFSRGWWHSRIRYFPLLA